MTEEELDVIQQARAWRHSHNRVSHIHKLIDAVDRMERSRPTNGASPDVLERLNVAVNFAQDHRDQTFSIHINHLADARDEIARLRKQDPKYLLEQVVTLLKGIDWRQRWKEDQEALYCAEQAISYLLRKELRQKVSNEQE